MLSNKQGPAASDAWHTSGMGRALMLAVAALVVLPTAAPAAATAPTLVVVDPTPLTIRGRGFATDRDVTVIVRTPTMTERRTLAPRPARELPAGGCPSETHGLPPLRRRRRDRCTGDGARPRALAPEPAQLRGTAPTVPCSGSTAAGCGRWPASTRPATSCPWLSGSHGVALPGFTGGNLRTRTGRRRLSRAASPSRGSRGLRRECSPPRPPHGRPRAATSRSRPRPSRLPPCALS